MQNITTAVKVGFLVVIAVLPWLVGGVDSGGVRWFEYGRIIGVLVSGAGAAGES